MKKKCTVLFLSLAFALSLQIPAEAQILNKLKKKAEDALLGKDKQNNNQDNNSTNSNSNTNNNSNSVQGKKLTPPNVNEHLDNASAAIKTTNPSRYSTTRFELKQAIMGLELEIGNDILKSMPTSVNGMNYKAEEDEVVSTGIGFVGFLVGRHYDGNKKSMRATINNNSAVLSSYNMLLTNSASSNGQTDHKVVTVQGNRSLLQFDGKNTYTLVVPFGQSSYFLGEFDNFADENEVMSAVNNFKIADYMSLLDEK